MKGFVDYSGDGLQYYYDCEKDNWVEIKFFVCSWGAEVFSLGNI